MYFVFTYSSLAKVHLVCYSLGIYLLNLFLAFLQPKFDPSLTQDEGLEDGESSLPTKQDDEFRPFIRRLPEFKFWHSATRAIAISFVCTWFSIFNVPVFWPVLVVYFIILFSLTSKQIFYWWIRTQLWQYLARHYAVGHCALKRRHEKLIEANADCT